MEAVEAAFTKPPEVKRTQALLSEFIGTFFLLFVIQTTRTGGVLDGYVGVGVTVGGMIYAFDHVSGAHFNPAVTLGVVLNGRMGIGTALLYVAAQLLGAFAGALASLATAMPLNVAPLLPESSAPFGSIGSAVAVELLYTLALVLVQQNAGLEKNGREPNSYFGLAVSFTVLAGAAAVQRISGGCFNPAVGTALDFAALIGGSGDMRNVWIYWVGPLAGAAGATALKVYMNLTSHQVRREGVRAALHPSGLPTLPPGLPPPVHRSRRACRSSCPSPSSSALSS